MLATSVQTLYRDQNKTPFLLRWPGPIYQRFGYVFESRFTVRKNEPISLIFGILSKE